MCPDRRRTQCSAPPSRGPNGSEPVLICAVCWGKGSDQRHSDYCLDFLYRAHRAGLRIREISFRCLDRQAGETKTGATVGQFLLMGVTHLKTILKLKWSS